jgi:uncharacterized membrane protein YccC
MGGTVVGELDPVRPEDDSLTYQECCDRLNIALHTLRQMLFEYSEIIGEEGSDEQRLSREGFDRLRRIVALSEGGADREQIRAVLAPANTAPSAVAPAASPTGLEALTEYPDDPVLERLDRLTRQLELSEARQREERDRVLLALIRAQQEIEHLRYEVAAASTRKDRKKKGFWARLLEF